ncbi:MAG: hypothetical protein HFG75_06030 [Hungatella sp.]|nr:hypothetical protein [Hungatella sp.]
MSMNKKLKEVFGRIQAEEELKNRTRLFLDEKTLGYTAVRKEKRPLHVCAAACVCLLLLFGGHWLYFTPTVVIGIDINPSIQLSINRFDQVIFVNGFNEDGQELSRTLNITFRDYRDAMEQILNDDHIVRLLSDNEIMTITVAGPAGLQSEKILSEVELCTAAHRNTYCYLASSEEVAAAREMGLSYGKYRAFMEVRNLAPEITAETIQEMSMREIRELLERLSTDSEEPSSDRSRENGHHGHGRGHGDGWGRGRREQRGGQ